MTESAPKRIVVFAAHGDDHHGLNLGMPEHRAQLRAAMKEFLSLEA